MEFFSPSAFWWDFCVYTGVTGFCSGKIELNSQENFGLHTSGIVLVSD